MTDGARRRSRIRTLALAGAASLLFVSAPALAQQQAYDIPTTSLSEALRDFGQVSGKQIIFTDDLVRGKKSAALKGNFTSEEALSRLLVGSGLRAEVAPSGAIMIVSREGNGNPAGESAPSSGEEQATGTAASNEAIVVTGTNIRGRAPAGSPLTVFSRQDILSTGAITLQDFAKYVPQNFALVDADTSVDSANGSAGTNFGRGASFNLRGLGPGATLTLLDGHRMAPAGTDGSQVDISAIPLSAIRRVEVLGDGASAIYGSDAVAGVVNVILRDDFRGAETTATYGDSTRGGAEQYNVSQLFGTAWSGGNAMLALNAGAQNPLVSTQRSFIPATTIGTANGSYFVIPRQRQQDLFGVINQELAPNIVLFGNAYLADRKFTQSQTDNIALLLTSTKGYARAQGATAGVNSTLFDRWNTTLSGTYAATQQHQDLTIGTNAPLPTTRDSRVMSLDFKADGPLLHLPAGSLLVSFGGQFRHERFDPKSSTVGVLQRHVWAAFGELNLPIVSSANATLFAQRLELSLAARYDNYSDFGSSGLQPKAGILWEPVHGLSFRASYAHSFRAPLLSQLTDASDTFLASNLVNPASPTGKTATLLKLGSGNPSLVAETAKSFTAGLDFKPAVLPGLSITATYYHIRFDNRIANPPLPSFARVFLLPDISGPFVQLSPSLAFLQNIYSTRTVIGAAALPPTAIVAFYDGTPHNLALTVTSGVEFSAEYPQRLPTGELRFSVSGRYIGKFRVQTAPSVAPTSLLNTIFNPVDWVVHGGVAWSRPGLETGIIVNYVDHYQNTFSTPPTRIGSWTTVDWHVALEPNATGGVPWLDGFRFSLAVQNLFDRDPPRVTIPNPGSGSPAVQGINPGFDGANASPLGRFISLSVTKRW